MAEGFGADFGDLGKTLECLELEETKVARTRFSDLAMKQRGMNN